MKPDRNMVVRMTWNDMITSRKILSL
jgi:hypothetical protein